MSEPFIEPPLAVLPPFVLPDDRGVPVNTAGLRGRRNLALFLLPEVTLDAARYLAAFSARHEEWSWLHTAVIVVVPETRPGEGGSVTGIPVLHDSGAVRAALLPDVAPDVAALFVADTEGRIAKWQTARRVDALPDADTVLAWAWEVARPRGACDGGVTWARPETVTTMPPVPIGRFAIGDTHRREGSRYHKKR